MTFALRLEDYVQVGDNSEALNSVVGAAGFIFSTAKSVMIRNSDISKQNPSNWLSLSPWVLPFRFSQIHSRKIPQGRTVVSVFDQTRTIGIHRRFHQHKSSGLRRAFSTHHPLIGFGSPQGTPCNHYLPCSGHRHGPQQKLHHVCAIWSCLQWLLKGKDSMHSSCSRKL